MKQHAIPQNILDVEFKLFTKFTIKEFVYIAIGIGFGGIFLYFFSTGKLPGIIAFPIFIVSSGIGLFLGLVPINDQKADTFLKNYFSAISKPTQRVWLNEKINSKFKPDVGGTTGTMSRDANATGGRVIGATKQSLSKSQVKETVALDQEEAQKLKAIDAAAEGKAPPAPIQQESPAQQAAQQSKIIIGKQNAQQYLTQLPGIQKVHSNVNLRLVDISGLPVPQAVASLKDGAGKVLGVAKSDQEGNVLFQKPMPAGHYIIDLQSEAQTFPRVEMIIEDQNIPPVKITAITLGR